jgi:hypothetical protein
MPASIEIFNKANCLSGGGLANAGAGGNPAFLWCMVATGQVARKRGRWSAGVDSDPDGGAWHLSAGGGVTEEGSGGSTGGGGG